MTWLEPADNVPQLIFAVNMLEAIEKLLILQDRDRQILRIQEELSRVAPERASLQGKINSTQAVLDEAKLRVKQLESERKSLELQVDTFKQKIDKYSVQQFQTKKNDEFRALGHEIEMARKEIGKLDDQQIALMEKGEEAQKSVSAASEKAGELRKAAEKQMSELTAREQNLKSQLSGLLSEREALAAGVDDGARSRYERLLRNKGSNVVVGIQHGVCGGCHMKFPVQLVLSCKAQQEIVTCPNCGRILYYTRDMDLAVIE